jgi:hypothetical protein
MHVRPHHLTVVAQGSGREKRIRSGFEDGRVKQAESFAVDLH